MMSGPALATDLHDAEAAAGRRAFAWVALTLAVIFGLYASTVASMVEIWHRSDTFAHGFLVVPIFLYLVWQRRMALAQAPMTPFWPAAVLLAPIGFAWLLAKIAGALAPAQFAVVALVPCAIVAMFGWAWLRALLFPCLMLFFAVPFGEVFVPTLIDWTANVTVLALRASGVPVYQEASHFVVPSGRWSVVDACSGIRYLIASSLTGCLFAAVMYRSPVRQVAFVAASMVVPVIANWMRAYGIVMIGHLSDNRLATGVDHLVYGWLFFGIVMVLLFAVGRFWREDLDQPAESAAQAAARGATRPVQPRTAWAVAVVLALLPWPVAYPMLVSPLGGALPTLAIQPAGAWRPTAAFTDWTAVMQRPSVRPQPFVFHKGGERVGVQVGLYRDQDDMTKLITSSNRLVPETGLVHVLMQTRGSAQGIDFRQSIVKADTPLLVRDWYWLGDHTTRSDVRAKIALAFDKLLRRDDTSAWVIVYTPIEEGAEAAAAARLDAFMREMQPALDAALQGTRR